MTGETTTSDTADQRGDGSVRSRDAAVRLAWSPFQSISEGRADEGLADLDDAGTWWEMVNRVEQPMSRMKAVLAEILGVVPMQFDLIGSIVEGDRVALMVESHGEVDENTTYNNAYTFVMDLDSARDAVVGVREYADTLHAATVLIPTVIRALQHRGSQSALIELLGMAG